MFLSFSYSKHCFVNVWFCSADGEKAKGVTVEESYTGCMRNLVSKNPNGEPQKLSLAKPLMVTGNLYLGGCPYK